jgi:Fur family ferric uptake transcriptional regulator
MKKVTATNNSLYQYFAKHGYRLTAPRKEIITILSQNNNHPSIEEIYLNVHKKYPSIGITTVYRTLDLLVNMGLVHKFDFGEGKARFELIDHPDGIGHHHHLICVECKKIINYTDFIDKEVILFKKIENRLSKKYNFEINNHIIEFYGTCEDCKLS